MAATEYHFRLILAGPFSEQISDDGLLDATDALGEAGCDDASISVHANGLEVASDRAGPSLQEAIASAVQDVERAGFQVQSNEMDGEGVLP